VLRRAEGALEIVLQGSRNLLDIALNHLSLGRAYLLRAQQASEVSEDLGSLEQAAYHLNRAVDGLRQSGNQDEVPRGLLARAALHRVQGQYDDAQRDLEEALAIATRSSMRPYEADCHLEYARLHLAQGQKAQARRHLDEARAMIEEMGYHRRDEEVAALEGRL
jgi:tetratricopeptide (TPR) repeat protein